MIKKPKQAMRKDELVLWVYENDFDFYYDLYSEDKTFYEVIAEDLQNEEVYDIIWDEVYFGLEYAEYILAEGEAR